ncbi:21576_t:CDS:2 [Rhizophagus irregularis]|nr:21576_t:CDS:2 [Rhizophagus irregularis]
MKRCSKIKYLDMPNFNIFEFSISKRSLLSLSILKINIITCPEEIILELSKNIHNLKRIEFCLDNIESENSIYHNSTISDLSDSDSEDISIMSEENSKYNDNISTLILSQKNLREIKFIYVRSMVNLFKKKTIEHLSNSLRILELCNCTYLPIQAITNFINLTELKICFHKKDLIFVAKLIETTKDTLKILNIRPHTNNAIEVITNNTTYTIDTTLLSRNTSPSPLSIEYYLHAIKMVCSNIEVLPVWLGSTSLEEFEDLLKSSIKSSSPLLINIHLIEYSYFHLITTHFKKTPICCWNDCGSDHLFNFIQITSTFITNKKI